MNPNTTIAQAKAWLRTKLADGAECPVCTQRAQLYRRKVTSTMARSLIEMYRAAGLDYAHLPTVISSQRADEGKLAYWGLMEEEKVRRPDGGRAGYWRVTPRGEMFLKLQLNIPKYAEVYDGRVLGFDTTELVSIKDALGTRFDYSDLMAGR